MDRLAAARIKHKAVQDQTFRLPLTILLQSQKNNVGINFHKACIEPSKSLILTKINSLIHAHLRNQALFEKIYSRIRSIHKA